MNDVERAAWRAKTYLKSTQSPLGDLTLESFETILTAFARSDRGAWFDGPNNVLANAVRALQ